jgi:hypothetical protein
MSPLRRRLRRLHSQIRVLLFRPRCLQLQSRYLPCRLPLLKRNLHSASHPGQDARRQKLLRKNPPLRKFPHCNPASVQARRRHCRNKWFECSRGSRGEFCLLAVSGCHRRSAPRWKGREDSSSNPSGRCRNQICSGLSILPTRLTFWLVHLSNLINCIRKRLPMPVRVQ